MDYIKEIFNRANLQQLREFLLHESGTVTDTRSYQERLEAAYRQLLDFLKECSCTVKKQATENNR